MLEIAFSLIIALAIIVAITNEIYAHKLKVVPMASMPWVSKQIANAAKTHKSDAKVIYELGSGWGGLAHKLAKSFPAARVTGYELSPWPYITSKLFKRASNLQFYRQDIFTRNYHDADIIAFYLMPATIKELVTKLKTECRAGTLIIASGFPADGLTLVDTIAMNKGLEKHIYIYQI